MWQHALVADQELAMLLVVLQIAAGIEHQGRELKVEKPLRWC